MTLATNNKLSREQLQSLFLKHAGNEAANDVDENQLNEYNFHKPHYFNKIQTAKLNNYFETLSSFLANEFSKMANTEFNAKINSFDELFSENLINESKDEKMPYNLAFQDQSSSDIVGFLSIPEKSARLWTTLLLGETEPNQAEQFSQLELSLLIETATSFIKAFSDSDSSLTLKPVSETLSRSIPIPIDNCQEMSKIIFELNNKDEKNNSQASFILFSSCLNSIADKQNFDNNNKNENDSKELIVEHLKKQQVEIVASFAKIKLTIEDMVNLEADDVILLDKKTNQPIDLLVKGKSIFQAQTVQCKNSYGVKITKAINNNIN